MQAMKFIFKSLCAGLVAVLWLSGCGEKTPEQIAAENQKALEIAVKRAQVLMFEGKYEECAGTLEEASRNYGTNAALCELLAYSYIQTSRTADAAIFFEKASDMAGGNPQLLISSAKAYEQNGQFESAARAYEKYLKLKPRDMVAWKSLSRCLGFMNKYKDAVNAYLDGVKKSERNPNTREACDIGNLFLKVGNVVQGRRWLEAALSAVAPDNLKTRRDILEGLLSVYLAQKETALLEGVVKQLDEIDPNFVKGKYPQLHSQIEEFNKKLKEAQDALKAQEAKKAEEAKKTEEAKKAEASEKNSASSGQKPQNGDDARQNSAHEGKTGGESAKKADGSGEPAAEPEIKNVEIKDVHAEPAPKKTPEELLIDKAYALISEGKPAEASKTANLAVAENRNSPSAWRALALAYDAEGRSFDSYMAAREAYVRNSDDINATLLYIRTASGVLNNEQFLNALYRAQKKFPNNSEIMLGLARTYKIIGDKPNAKYFYNAFLNDTPKEHPLYDEVNEEFEEYVSGDSK